MTERRRRPRRGSGGDGGPAPIGDALRSVARDLGLDDPARTGALLAAWPGIAGPAVAAHSTPHSLRGGTLTVLVDAPVWATQIAALESRLLDRIADEVGGGLCTALRVKVDPGTLRQR